MIKKILKIMIIMIVFICCILCESDNSIKYCNNYNNYFELLNANFNKIIYNKNKEIEANLICKTFKNNIKIDSIETKKLLIYIDSLCKIHNIDYKYVIGIISSESRWNNNAIGGDAYGLMQMTPIATNSIKMEHGEKQFNIYYNVKSGILFLSALNKKYNDMEKTLVAYNTGSAYVDSSCDIKYHNYLIKINYWIDILNV